MADEKTIKIKVDVEGSPGPDPAEVEKQRQRAAEQLFKQQQKLAAQVTQAAQQTAPLNYGVNAWQQGQQQNPQGGGGKRGPGRPGKVYPTGYAQHLPKGHPAMQGQGQQPAQPPQSPFDWKDLLSLEKALKGMQKVVTAINGTNGHMTKVLAVVNRSYSTLNKTINQAQAAHKAAAVANGQTAAAATKGAAAVGGMAASLGTLLGATTVAAVGVGALAIAAKVATAVFENLQEVVGEFSASLQKARAETDITLIRARIRSAGRIGEELSSLESANREIKKELIDLKTNVVDYFGPILAGIGQTLAAILKVVNNVMSAMNGMMELIESSFETILELLSHIPLLGKAARKALDWMRKDDIDSAGASALNKNVEDLFSPTNLGFPEKPKKNSIPQRFLP